jgi:glycosyltransferase involved in cell wall biosynthesis
MTHPKEHMPRVLIVDLAKYYGGADVRVLELARTLEQRGHYYSVAALEGSPLYFQLRRENLSVLPVPYSRANPLLVPFLMRAIRRHGFTVVDAHNSQSQFWAMLAGLFLRGVRTICTVHSAYRLEHNGTWKGRMYEQVLRLNAFAKGRFIAVSEAVAGYLQNVGIAQKKISLIHNSLRLPEPQDRSGREPLLEALGWAPSSFVVIVVGRLEPVKGHAVLLKAIKKASAMHPQLRCLIVGGGRMQESLEEQTAQLGLQDRVHFTGFRDDVPALLAASDAFCLPSLSEGLPYALLEAAAFRLPLLVSNVGGMAALLTDQKDALLVPPANPQALASGMTWMMENRQAIQQFADAAFDLIQQRFNCEEMIEDTVAVYRQTVRATKGDPAIALRNPSKVEVWKA